MLNLLYEDDVLLFVDKPAGIVVQRGHDADEPVLLEQVQQFLAEKGQEAFLMQRLDRGTSGVLFFTKQSRVNAAITRQFERKEIRKQYVAICSGRLEREVTIDAPLARVGPISFGVRPEGRRAVTVVTPLAASDGASVVSIALLTGRTHQIRVHLAHIGHPLVGDWLYGARDAARPMLHAAELALRHPIRNEPLAVSARLPEDFLEEARARGLLYEQQARHSPHEAADCPSEGTCWHGKWSVEPR